jgi:hypothetical protein
MLLPTRDNSRIRNASSKEKPIFIKAEIIPPIKRKVSPKIRTRIKRRSNVRLKGI